MTEDFPEDEGRESDAPVVAHDDIMQRLLRYQRELRGEEHEEEVASASEPTDIAAPGTTADAPPPVPQPEAPMVEAPWTAEPEPWVESPAPQTVPPPPTAWVEPPETSGVGSSADLARRVGELEATIAHVARMVTDLRERFQDMAIAADERLGDIERALSGRPPDEPSSADASDPS